MSSAKIASAIQGCHTKWNVSYDHYTEDVPLLSVLHFPLTSGIPSNAVLCLFVGSLNKLCINMSNSLWFETPRC